MEPPEIPRYDMKTETTMKEFVFEQHSKMLKLKLHEFITDHSVVLGSKRMDQGT